MGAKNSTPAVEEQEPLPGSSANDNETDTPRHDEPVQRFRFVADCGLPLAQAEALWDTTRRYLPWCRAIHLDKCAAATIDLMSSARVVQSLLPAGDQVAAMEPHGTSKWGQTAIVETVRPDGMLYRYFIKTTTNPAGYDLVKAEFAALEAIHHISLDLCPAPVRFGALPGTSSQVHFIMMQYLDFTYMPPPTCFAWQETEPWKQPDQSLAANMASLHAIAVSPDGLFGFDQVLAGSQVPLSIDRSPSWEAFFTTMLRAYLAVEEQVHGPLDEERQALKERVLTRVIPRLLRPLETGGRSIKPRLVHGDLWIGNTGWASKPVLTTAVEIECLGTQVIFDPASFYAHNEADLAWWWCHRMGAVGKWLAAQYHNYFPKSAPKEDWPGRLTLYLMLNEARASINTPHDSCFRVEAYKVARDVDEQFPETYAEWAAARGEPAYERLAA